MNMSKKQLMILAGVLAVILVGVIVVAVVSGPKAQGGTGENTTGSVETQAGTTAESGENPAQSTESTESTVGGETQNSTGTGTGTGTGAGTSEPAPSVDVKLDPTEEATDASRPNTSVIDFNDLLASAGLS